METSVGFQDTRLTSAPLQSFKCLGSLPGLLTVQIMKYLCGSSWPVFWKHCNASEQNIIHWPLGRSRNWKRCERQGIKAIQLNKCYSSQPRTGNSVIVQQMILWQNTSKKAQGKATQMLPVPPACKGNVKVWWHGSFFKVSAHVSLTSSQQKP